MSRHAAAFVCAVVLFTMVTESQTLPAPLHFVFGTPGDGTVEDAARDGDAVTVHIVDRNDANAYARDNSFRASVSDLDLPRSEVWDDDGHFKLSLKCKTEKSDCWHRIGRMGAGRDAPVANDEWADKHGAFVCTSRQACQSFLDGLKGPDRSAPAAAPRPPASGTTTQAPSSRPIDCNALRATYGASGARPVLPPECLTENERAATYAPAARTATSAAAPPASEPVIDGSRVPSRIDFPGPAPAPAARPVPAPVATAPAVPATPSPAPPPPPSPAPAAAAPSPAYPVVGVIPNSKLESFADQLDRMLGTMPPSAPPYGTVSDQIRNFLDHQAAKLNTWIDDLLFGGTDK